MLDGCQSGRVVFEDSSSVDESGFEAPDPNERSWCTWLYRKVAVTGETFKAHWYWLLEGEKLPDIVKRKLSIEHPSQLYG